MEQNQDGSAAAPRQGSVGRDRITLIGVGAVGTHGVLEQEKTIAQPFFTDAVLYRDLSQAGRTDDLSRTVDYGAVAETIKDVVMGPSVELIETLAHTMAQRILERFPVDAVELTVHKPKAPIEVTFGDVSVTIHRERA